MRLDGRIFAESDRPDVMKTEEYFFPNPLSSDTERLGEKI